jgi:glyoxylase-like metal-dependent hydrolase (beta-lactamase superfamily II)
MTKNKLRQISDHVWIFPPNRDRSKVEPLIGIVCTQSQTVLVDAGNSPAQARRVLVALQEINAPPLTHVVYTHHHWDHTFGAQTYNVPVVAHAMCKALTIAYKKLPWGPDSVMREPLRKMMSYSVIDRLLQDEWDTFEIIVPSIVIEERKGTFTFDGLTLELELVGGAHSDDSTVITVVDDGVMFLGDSFYPSPRKLTYDEINYDLEMMGGFLERKLAYYADGHGGAYRLKTWQTWFKMQ